MKKQFQLIIVALFLTSLTGYGQVGSQFTFNNITYEVTAQDGPKTVMAIGYNTDGGHSVNIPPTVDHDSNTYTVTAIGEAAFEGKGLTSVIIPNTVTSIRSRAFHNNQLTSVTISNSVTVIGRGAFYNNQLTSVIIPGSVTSIGAQAFQYNKLTEVTISDGVTTIGGEAFRNNLLQGRLEIPNSVTSIGHRVFYNNDLAEVIIGENVTSIGDDAFRDNNLTRVTIPNSVTSIGKDAFQQNELAEVTFSTPSHLTRLEEGVFKANNLTGVTIPDGVISIGNSAFSSNQLIEVIIPGSVTDIGPWAFSNPNLNLVTVQATVPPRIQDNTFSNRSQIDVVVPRGSGRIKDAYENENAWGTGFRSITEEVGDGDFFTVGNLRYQVSSVDSHEVFVAGRASGSTDTGITIPRVVSVAAQDFKVIGTNGGSFRANNLTRVTFESPSNVTRIDGDTFRDNNLTSVTIPENVIDIGPWAFASNPNLNLVTVEATTPPALDATAFQGLNNTDLRSQIDLVVPRGARDAYNNPTNGWTGFRSITDGIQVSIDTPAQRDNLTPFSVTITFSRNVTGFAQADIQIANATAGSFSPVDGTTYTLEITPTSCEGTITIEVPENVVEYAPNFPNLAASTTVMVNAIPSAPTVSSPLEYCVGETATALTASGDNLLWYTSPTDETGDTAALTPGTANEGSTSYFVTQTTNGCESERAEIVVTVEANGNCGSAAFTIAPIADVTLQENTIYTSVTPVLSGDDPKGTVTWTLGGTDAEDFSVDGSTGVVTMIARDFEAPADANADNVYEVSITDSEHNSSETSWTVTVKDDPFETPSQGSLSPMIPTAFTPNGDSANDRWIIDNLSGDATVRIYNRHGTILFTSDAGYTLPWDGTYRGHSLPAGSYIYHIQNGSHKYTGTVTILL